MKFEEFSTVNADNIRERIEDPTAFRPEILVVQLGAMELGMKDSDPAALAKKLTFATDLAFQESTDLTVFLGDFRREDEGLAVTPETYLARLKTFNAKIQEHFLFIPFCQDSGV